MIRNLVILGLSAPPVLACPTGSKVSTSTQEKAKLMQQLRELAKHHRAPAQSTTMPLLPDAQSTAPWGGPDSRIWKPEAILANAASRALNRGWAERDVADVLVAVPVQMIYSNKRVYCDGQTNAALQFGRDWRHSEPPLVVTLLKLKGGSRRIKFLFAKELPLTDGKITVTGFVPQTDGSMKRFDVPVAMTKGADGFAGSWEVPQEVVFGDLTSSRVLWIKSGGAGEVFPIDFRMPVVGKKDLLNASPAKSMGKDRSLLDPMNIFVESQQNRKLAIEQLLTTAYGREWDQHTQGPYEPGNIHAEIEVGGATVATATGKGWTWVANKNSGQNVPFKNLYTCFDKRNFSEESRLGVPSGGGWHEIGDAAETIINNLESAPVVVGMATGVPWPTPPDSWKFSFGLKDVAVIRFLKPGEALITPAGDQTWREDQTFRSEKDRNPGFCGNEQRAKGDGGGRNYHWFSFQYDVPVCTQEWVHNCVPTANNGFGLNCPN